MNREIFIWQKGVSYDTVSKIERRYYNSDTQKAPSYFLPSVVLLKMIVIRIVMEEKSNADQEEDPEAEVTFF